MGLVVLGSQLHISASPHFLSVSWLFFDFMEVLRSFSALCLFVMLLMIEALRLRPSWPSMSKRMPFFVELCSLCTTNVSWNFTVIFFWNRSKWSFGLPRLFLLVALSEPDP